MTPGWVHTAGDTLSFQVNVPDFLSTDGWTLTYYLTPRFASPSQAQIVLVAAGNDDGSYQVQESAANTANWKPGAYGWHRRVEKAGVLQTLSGSEDQGECLVRANPATLTQGHDGRSQAAKAVDDLEVAMATFNATSGRVKRYAIGSRQMEFETADEIKNLLTYWRNKLTVEEANARLASGEPGAPRLLARL